MLIVFNAFVQLSISIAGPTAPAFGVRGPTMRPHSPNLSLKGVPMKRLALVFSLLIGILAVGCGQSSSLQGRYNAAEQSVYSAIELLPGNVAKRSTAHFSPSAYTTSYDRKGNFNPNKATGETLVTKSIATL